MHHVRERGHMRTIFCIMTTEKMRSGFLVFPKHYLHLLMQLRFVLIFVTKYFHKVKNITEIMIKIKIFISNTVHLQSVILLV